MHFETPLLAQSLVMIVVQLLLLHACVSAFAKSDVLSHSHHAPVGLCTFVNVTKLEPLKSFLVGLSWQSFWKWHRMQEYMLTITGFSLVAAVLTALLGSWSFYSELVGLVSLLLEASLGLPQFLKNYEHASTHGMRCA